MIHKFHCMYITLVRVTQLGGVAMTTEEKEAVLQARQDADRDYQVWMAAAQQDRGTAYDMHTYTS